MLWLIVIAVSMWILQLALGLWQFKQFNRSFKELRQLGRVAIGKAKGKFSTGAVVLLCINQEATIIAGRKMQGMTIFAKPRDFAQFNGRQLTSLTEADCTGFDKSVRIAVLNAVENYKTFVSEAKAAEAAVLASGSE